MKEFILGGIRSGKSQLAEQRASDSGLAVTYIATATPQDAEMQARIATHQQRRPASWSVLEEPIALAATLQQHAAQDRCLLVDCLSLWLTNLLLNKDEDLLERERTALLQLLPQLPGRIIFVSTESGLGIIPNGELSRRFCDEAGILHQSLAQICERVILTVAGLPHVLKGTSNEF